MLLIKKAFRIKTAAMMMRVLVTRLQLNQLHAWTQPFAVRQRVSSNCSSSVS